MGADENAQAKLESIGAHLSDEILRRLDDGWRVVVGENEQLMLLPPSGSSVLHERD